MFAEYLIGYYLAIPATNLISRARRAAGLSQSALARRAGTSRPTLSAYERDRKSPSLKTTARIAAAAGFDLALEPAIVFSNRPVGHGRSVVVPSALPRLPLHEAFATVDLPLHLNWSAPGRRFALRDRADRARVYEIVLREGGADDILQYVDGALLIDLWDELVLPAPVRTAWEPLIARAADGAPVASA